MREISFEIKIPKIQFSRKRRRRIQIIISCLIVVAVFAAKQNFEFTFVGTLILAYLAVSLLWNLSSRIATSFALFFLACTPMALILKKDVLAETLAIYAYYFLVITVVSEIMARKKKNSKTSGNNLPVDNSSGRVNKKIV